MKAFLLAAGFGTRLKPFTDHHPKALASVNGQSLLERGIRKLQNSGVYDVVVNVHHFAEQIIETLQVNKGFGSRFEISDERDAVLETGGGLLKARPFLEGAVNFVVMNVDILSNIDLQQLIQHHQQQKALATLAVMQRDATRKLVFDENMQLYGWKNLTTESYRGADITPDQHLQDFAFSGIQVMQAEIFQHIRFQGKFSLIDLYLDLAPFQKICGYDHSGDLLLDVGKPDQLEKAKTLFP